MKKRPSSGKWPDSHWGKLFLQASALLTTLDPVPYWSFGGGTALALRYGHRISYDVDIFLHDAQVLGYLTPRLNSAAASLSDAYDETSSSIKITTPHGDIDFLISPTVTETPSEAMSVQGIEALVETPAEILAKKIKYRGHAFTHRDIFDLALLMTTDAGQVETALDACGSAAVHSTARAIAARLPTLQVVLPDYVNPTTRYRPLLGETAGIVRGFPGVVSPS